MPSTKRLRCMFAVKDELHDYAEAIGARMLEHLGARPRSVQDLGMVDSSVLHRTGYMQAELIRIRPGSRIAVHRHPQVDSIDLLVAGNVAAFMIGAHQVPRFIHGIGLRIAESAPHGGEAGPQGLVVLSCQRWAQPPSHITLAWRGSPLNDVHERLLDALEVTA